VAVYLPLFLPSKYGCVETQRYFLLSFVCVKKTEDLPVTCNYAVSNSQTSCKCESADGNCTRPKFAKARAYALRVRSPCHCTGHPWCRLHAHRCCVSSPSSSSPPHPPPAPDRGLPRLLLPHCRSRTCRCGALACALLTHRSTCILASRSPAACSPLAWLLVCSLVCLLARVLAHSPFLTCRPPASPPQTHDCPAVMGLRLVFASGGGSPWFNFIWSSN
jgi:hypothetical protein